MGNPYELEAGDTCYWNGEECDVVRGYNGLNMRIDVPSEEGERIIDPRGVTHPDDYEPPEEPEPEPEVEPDEGDGEEPDDEDTETESEGEEAGEDFDPYVCDECGEEFGPDEYDTEAAASGALAGHSGTHSDDE